MNWQKLYLSWMIRIPMDMFYVLKELLIQMMISSYILIMFQENVKFVREHLITPVRFV